MKSVPKRRGSAKVAESAEGNLPGGGPRNTPLQTRDWTCGGDDTAHIGVGVEWGEECRSLFADLEREKQTAQESGEPGTIVRNGLAFAVHPTGYRAGGGAGSFFAYAVEHMGIRIGISKRPEPIQQTPNVRVQIGSLMLMEVDGLESAWSIVKTLIETLGGKILWNKLSRVDMCADLPGVGVDEFVRLFDAKQYVTRARDAAVYYRGENSTGFTIGSDLLMLRVYDKVAECEKQDRKYQTMVRKRWGTAQSKATRVEFQLRRDTLKTFKVDSVEDYLEKRAAIARYLGTKWIRFTDGPVNRANTEKMSVHSLWLRVLDCFKRWTGCPDASIVRERVKGTQRDRLVRQAMGCMSAYIAAYTDGEILPLRRFLDEVREIVKRTMDPDEIADMQVRKAVDWYRTGPTQKFGQWAIAIGAA